MKRSSYRGEHKGSTLKARTKIYGMRVLNIALSVVLVVGLAPSISFAGEQAVESPAAEQPQQPVEQPQAPQEEQQVVQDEQPQQQAEEQAQQPESNTQGTLTLQGGATSGSENAKGDGQGIGNKSESQSDATTSEQTTGSETSGSANNGKGIAAASLMTASQGDFSINYGTPQGAIQTEGSYFTKDGGDFKVIVSGKKKYSDYTILVTLDGTPIDSPEITKNDEEPSFTASFTCSVPANSGDPKSAEHTIVTTITANEGGDSLSETKKVIVDNRVPVITDNIVWAYTPNTSETPTTSDSGTAVTLHVKEGEQSNVTVTAKITATSNYTLTPISNTVGTVASDQRGSFATGRTESGIALSEDDTLRFDSTTGWSPTGNLNEYQCTVTLKGPLEGNTGTAHLTIAAVDELGNVSAAYVTDKYSAIAMTLDPDGIPPTLAMEYSPRGRMADAGTLYYNLSDFASSAKITATATFVEVNGGASFTASFTGGTEDTKTRTDQGTLSVEQDIDKETHNNDGSYTVIVSGNDRVDNKLKAAQGSGLTVTDGVYTQNILVDTINPKIEVKYTDNADTEQTLANGATGIAKYNTDGTTATVTVTDANFDADNTKVYLNDSETAESITLSSGVAAPINLAAEAGAVSSTKIKVVATDLVGNTVEQTGTLTVDRKAPEAVVTWENDAHAKADNTTYYKSRAATITLTADDLTLEDLNAPGSDYVTATVTSTSGKPVPEAGDDGKVALTWKAVDGQDHTFITESPISFRANAMGCTLSVSAKDKFGNTDSETVTGFSMLPHPVVSVSLSPMPANVPHGKTGVTYYARDEEGKLTATVKIKDIEATTNIASIVATGSNPVLGGTGVIGWDEGAGIERTGTVAFESDTPPDATSTLTIIVPNTYVGAGSDAAGGVTFDGAVDTTINTGKYELTNFIIDRTPPVQLSVAFTPSGLGPVDGKLYFKDKATAIATVTETNLSIEEGHKGENMSLRVDGVSGNVADYSFSGEFVPGDSGKFKVEGISFPKVEGEVAEYKLTISGSDLLGQALAKTGDEEAYITNNTYERNIVIDNEKPLLSVTYGAGTAFKPSDDAALRIVDKQGVAVTVSVAEALFADGGLTIVDTAKNSAGEAVTEPIPAITITHDAENHKYDATFTLGGAETDAITHTLTITGTDVAGNPMGIAENGIKIGDTPTEVGALTAETGKYVANVVVDQMSPELMVTSSVEAAQTKLVNNVPTYYYGKTQGYIRFAGNVVDDTRILANGMTATISEGGTQKQAKSSAAGTAFDDIFAGDWVLQADGTISYEVTGTDAAGNMLKPKNGDGNLAKAEKAIVEGAFKVNAVYDMMYPGISVQYKEEGAESWTALGYNTDNAAVGKTVTLKATFQDGDKGSGIDKDSQNTTFTYQADDGSDPVVVSGDKLTWEGNSASFNVPVAKDKAVTYTVVINAQDMAGNGLIGNQTTAQTSGEPVAYTAKITIDNTPPTLLVTYATTGSSKVVNEAKPNERRYYNAEATATITIVEKAATFDPTKISIGGSQTAADEWDSDGDTHTYNKGMTYDSVDTTSKDLTISGTDSLGNKLKSADTETVCVTDGSYKSNITVDKVKPTVEVKYTTASITTPQALPYDKSYATPALVNETVTVSATFTDAGGIDTDSNVTKFTYTIGDSSEVHVATATWTGNVATFKLPQVDNAYTIYKVQINGKDLAGNDLAGDPSDAGAANPFDAEVIIDRTPPKLTVNYVTTGQQKIIDQARPNERRYYDKDATAYIMIEEGVETFDATRIYVDGVATSDGDWTHSGDTHTYQVPKTYTSDGAYQLRVSGSDKLGNKLASADTKTVHVDKNGNYASSIFIDTITPDVAVTMDKARAGRDGADYFDAAVSATVVVTDANFDKDANTPQSIINVSTDKVSVPAQWSVSGNTYTAVLTFAEDSSSSEPYSFTVKPTDIIGHTLDYRYGDKETHAIGGGNKSTVAEGDTLVDTMYGPTFHIDTKSPDVEISMLQVRTFSYPEAGIDYYGVANENNRLEATISVTDPTFVSGNAKVTDNGAPVEQNLMWTRSGDTFTTTVSFAENFGDMHTLKVEASDKISTFKQGVHEVAFNYGDPAISGSAIGGNFSAQDATGNPLNTNKQFVLDLTEPALTATEATGFATRWDSDGTHLFYTASGSGVSLTMTDANGVRFASAAEPYSLQATENLGKSSVQFLGLIEGTDVNDRDNKNAIMRGALVKMTDYVGNYSIWNITETGEAYKLAGGAYATGNAAIAIRDGSSVHPLMMVLDQTAPVLTWGERPTEGQFYNTAQSALLNVAEMNFDYLRSLAGDRVIATVTHYSNDAGRGQSTTTIPAGTFDGSGSDWATIIPFNAEGHYTVTAQFEDIAGNLSNEVSLGEFTLDWTAPTCTISWDNNDARNGNYYKSGRTATITVTEHNFLASDFTVETTGSVGGWSSNGDTHTCVVTFSTDGRYTLTVNGHDRAGNAMATMTEPEFIVDLTAPTIDFSNVTAQTAYGDVIEPVINYHDEANFDSNGMQWTLTGNKNGAQTFAASQGSSGNDGNVTFSDFPRQVEADDIYTLQAHLTDMAGNEADGNITFSVNRFGSNFIILDKDTFSKGYLEKPIEVRVQEINVSGAKPDKDQAVTITKDLTTTNLKKKTTGTPTSDGFYIESGSDSAGWSSYTYHIGTDNFAKHDSTGAVVKKDGETLYDDGSYHVIISSNDTAENLNSSASYYDPTQHKTTSAEVSFILDSAMPIIDNINISSGQTYDANAMKEVSFIVTDNTGTPDVTVTLDGETIDVTPGMGGACSLGLDQIPPKAWTPRNLEITVVDSANNVVTAKVENFHWTTDFLELNLFFVIGGVVVVAAAVVGGVMFVRRRNSVPTL